jgi:hypothetical protein
MKIFSKGNGEVLFRQNCVKMKTKISSSFKRKTNYVPTFCLNERVLMGWVVVNGPTLFEILTDLKMSLSQLYGPKNSSPGKGRN